MYPILPSPTTLATGFAIFPSLIRSTREVGSISAVNLNLEPCATALPQMARDQERNEFFLALYFGSWLATLIGSRVRGPGDSSLHCFCDVCMSHDSPETQSSCDTTSRTAGDQRRISERMRTSRHPESIPREVYPRESDQQRKANGLRTVEWSCMPSRHEHHGLQLERSIQTFEA